MTSSSSASCSSFSFKSSWLGSWTSSIKVVSLFSIAEEEVERIVKEFNDKDAIMKLINDNTRFETWACFWMFGDLHEVVEEDYVDNHKCVDGGTDDKALKSH